MMINPSTVTRSETPLPPLPVGKTFPIDPSTESILKNWKVLKVPALSPDILRFPNKVPNPLDMRISANPSLDRVNPPGDCTFACTSCGLTSLGNCVECIRCIIARAIKTVAIDILLAALLLLGIYLLFQRQANTAIRTAARAAVV